MISDVSCSVDSEGAAVREDNRNRIGCNISAYQILGYNIGENNSIISTVGIYYIVAVTVAIEESILTAAAD
ncbi:MAG: hypothetical protein K6G55_04370 [Selenomonadaceae bacterium]|nr:hypothetical protein [Selenomonadaceae bacterium]